MIPRYVLYRQSILIAFDCYVFVSRLIHPSAALFVIWFKDRREMLVVVGNASYASGFHSLIRTVDKLLTLSSLLSFYFGSFSRSGWSFLEQGN